MDNYFATNTIKHFWGIDLCIIIYVNYYYIYYY